MADTDICVVNEYDLDLVARILRGECDNQPVEGIQAVSYVIKTRTFWTPPAWWGSTIRQVCLFGKVVNGSNIHQFSCVNDSARWDDLMRVPSDDPDILRLKEIARDCFEANVPNPVPGVTHYYVEGTNADWAVGHEGTQIGAHVFFAIGPVA